jgi:hypothetical protein
LTADMRRPRPRKKRKQTALHTNSHPFSQRESKREKGHVIFVFTNLIDSHPASQRESKRDKAHVVFSSLVSQRVSKRGKEHVVFVLINFNVGWL